MSDSASESPNAANPPRGAPVFAVVCVMLVIAAAIRFHRIGAQQFWIDEIFSLQTSAGNGLAHERFEIGAWLDPAPTPTDIARGEGVRGIIRHAGEDTQAPLYFVVLLAWRNLFGSGELAVRAISAFASIAVVAGVMRWACIIARDHPAARAPSVLLAGALAAFSGTQVFFAQEARPYALMLVFCLACTLILIEIEHCGATAWRLIALIGSMLAMMFTHYTSAGCAAALGLYCLLRLHGNNRSKTLLSFAVAAVIFLAAWGPVLAKQREQPANRLAFLRDDEPNALLRTIDRAIRQPSAMVFALPTTTQTAPATLLAARVFGVAMIVIPLLLLRRDRQVLLPWLVMIVPILLTAASDILSARGALELSRFTFVGSAGAVMILATIILRLPPRARPIAAGGAVTTCMFALIAPQWLGTMDIYDRPNPPTQFFAKFVKENVRGNDRLIVVVPHGQQWQAGAMYSAMSHYAGAWPGPVLFTARPVTADLLTPGNAAANLFALSPTPALPPGMVPYEYRLEHQMTVRNMGTIAKIVPTITSP